MSLSKLSWTNWDVFYPDQPDKAFVSDQGQAGTCVRHAIGKGIFDYLEKSGRYVNFTELTELKAKQQEVIDKVLELFPDLADQIDDPGCYPFNYHGKSISQDGIRLTMEITCALRKRDLVSDRPGGKIWSPAELRKNDFLAALTFMRFADKQQRASFLKESSNFLILCCDTSIFDGKWYPNREGGHAVYVDDYDVKTRTFHCINSWSEERNPRPKIKDYDPSFQDHDTEFSVYRVHLVAEGPTRNVFSMASTLLAAPAGEGKHMYSFISSLKPGSSY